MAITDPVCSVIAIQAETSFNAASAATVYKFPGRISATFDVQHGSGNKFTSIWRHETQNNRFGTWYQGRIEWELAANDILKSFLDALFETKSTQANTPSSGYTTITYRPKRIGDLGSFKIGYEYEPDGPNYTFGGCIVTRLNFRAELNQMVRVSANFMAASRTESANSETSSYSSNSVGQTNNFESQYVEGAALPSSSGLSVGATLGQEGGSGPLNVAMEWDDTVEDMLVTAGVNFGHDHVPAKLTKAGVVQRWKPRSNFEANFSITKIVEDDTTLLEDAIDKSQHKLEVEFADSSDSTKKFKVTWPKTEIRNHDFPLMQLEQDRPATLALTGIQDADLNTGSEPEIVLVKTA